MKFAAIILAVAPICSFAASSNTINFQGNVSSQTCSVTINGNAATPVVLLPTVSSAVLNAAGNKAGLTKFTVGLTGCTDPGSNAQPVGTVFVGNQVTASGNLGNTGTAKNVSLQLVDPADPSAPLKVDGTTATSGLSIAAGQTSATHDFAVQYFAEAIGVTPGSVLGSVQYAINYQ